MEGDKLVTGLSGVLEVRGTMVCQKMGERSGDRAHVKGFNGGGRPGSKVS